MSIESGQPSMEQTIGLNARPVTLNVTIGAPERTKEKLKLYMTQSLPGRDTCDNMIIYEGLRKVKTTRGNEGSGKMTMEKTYKEEARNDEMKRIQTGRMK